MNLYQKWIDHLKQNNMNYIEHLTFALYHGFICLFAGFYLIVHSLLPCFFQKAGSDLLDELNKSFLNSKNK